jgi:hypothetical protein
VLEMVQGGGGRSAPLPPKKNSTQEYFLAANLVRGTYKKYKYFVCNYLGGVRTEKNEKPALCAPLPPYLDIKIIYLFHQITTSLLYPMQQEALTVAVKLSSCSGTCTING